MACTVSPHPTHLLFADTASSLLLEQRDAIENWDSFAAANGIKGWNGTVPVCEWGGVDCDGGSVVVL